LWRGTLRSRLWKRTLRRCDERHCHHQPANAETPATTGRKITDRLLRGRAYSNELVPIRALRRVNFCKDSSRSRSFADGPIHSNKADKWSARRRTQSLRWP
jgi:hypothetical protein